MTSFFNQKDHITYYYMVLLLRCMYWLVAVIE